MPKSSQLIASLTAAGLALLSTGSQTTEARPDANTHQTPALDAIAEPASAAILTPPAGRASSEQSLTVPLSPAPAPKAQAPAAAGATSPGEPTKPARKVKMTKAVTTFEIKAPRDLVWSKLTDFDNYPSIFKRMQSCKVTRKAGDQIFLETRLKPQMFVKQPLQHTVADVADKPNELRWWLVDGNFKHCQGLWKLDQAEDGLACKVTYTIQVDAGRFIPGALVSFLLHMVQNEAAQSLKHASEQDFTPTRANGITPGDPEQVKSPGQKTPSRSG